jgi:steroid 5-alpha reductase family enzyme
MNKPLQGIFALCVIVMWVLFGLGVSQGQWQTEQWAMLIIAHVLCLIVFYSFAYIFSYGYALSMLCVSLALISKFGNWPTFLIGGLCAAYGLRLWHFVFSRQRVRQQRGDPDTAAAVNARTPLGVKIFLWIMVSWLMSFMCMAVWLVGRSGVMTPWIVVGAMVMIIGLSLETIADNQKQIAKTTAPKRWVDSGLYTRMRQANYSGEIVFQLGLMLTVIGTAESTREYLLAWIAPFYVVILMYMQANTLDAQQLERYGQEIGYRDWRSRSGKILPF